MLAMVILSCPLNILIAMDNILMMCPFKLPEEEACLDLPYIALLEEVGQLQVRGGGLRSCFTLLCWIGR